MDELLITKPRTSHCWYGIFFDVMAKDTPITIKGIQSGCSSDLPDKSLQVRVWSCNEGSFMGHEQDPSRWTLCGEKKMELVEIPYDRFSFDSADLRYCDLPFGSPIKVAAGQRKGFLVHTNSIGGLVLRGGFGPEARINGWKIGQKTDETLHVSLCAGQVCAEEAFKIEQNAFARGFVGSMRYTLN